MCIPQIADPSPDVLCVLQISQVYKSNLQIS